MKHVCTFIALSLFWEWLLTTKWKWFLEETGGLCTFWPNQSQFPARSSNRTNWLVKTSNAGIFPQWKAFGNWMKTWGGFRSLTRSITICPSNQAAWVLRWNRVCSDSGPRQHFLQDLSEQSSRLPEAVFLHSFCPCSVFSSSAWLVSTLLSQQQAFPPAHWQLTSPLRLLRASSSHSCSLSPSLSFPKLSLPTATNAMILLCNVHGRRRSASRKQKTAVKLIFALTSISSDFNDKKVGGAKRALAFTLTYYSSVLVFFCNCNMAL